MYISNQELTMQRFMDEKLVELVKQQNHDAFEELVIRYLPLIKMRAQAYHRLGLEKEDLRQEGLLGLLHAATTYQPSYGIYFKTYAAVCIERNLIAAYRVTKRKKQIPVSQVISFHDTQNKEEIEKQISYSENTDPENFIIKKEEILLCKKRMKTLLSDLEFQILSLYVVGASYCEIAKRLSVDVKVVDNALQRIRKKGKKAVS